MFFFWFLKYLIFLKFKILQIGFSHLTLIMYIVLRNVENELIFFSLKYFSRRKTKNLMEYLGISKKCVEMEPEN